MPEVITSEQISSRKYWLKKIAKLSGNFGDDSDKVEQEISEDISTQGSITLLGHLRLCGAIPEAYGHDSTEEKLYSKYTDVIISKVFEAFGLSSAVIRERADVADVECVSDICTFVADAKAFRLSRTAKNQKDFKVQAMDSWKGDKQYALLVCPIYQLPSNTSQIYQQAITRSVCILSYTHLAVLLRYALTSSGRQAIKLLTETFKTVDTLMPSKNALAYWQPVNRLFISYDSVIRNMWNDEKRASIESIALAKQEALLFFASERTRLMQLSREDAIKEVLKLSKINSKIQVINSVSDNGLLNVGQIRHGMETKQRLSS